MGKVRIRQASPAKESRRAPRSRPAIDQREQEFQGENPSRVQERFHLPLLQRVDKETARQDVFS